MAEADDKEQTSSVPGKAKLAMKRGRPSLEQVARIEQAILTSARQLFLVEGFDGVSMEQIAARTGITRVTLYNRYGTKVALFHAVLRDLIAERFERADPDIPVQPVGLAAILRKRVSDMASALADPAFRGFHRLILSNRHRFPELGPMMHEVGYRRTVDIIVSDIKAAALRDAVPVARPELIAEQIITAIHGWFLQYDLVGDLAERDIETFGHNVVELLLLSRERW